MNTPAVAHARAQLTEAEAVAAKERRAQLVAQLRSTRSELRTETRKLEKLKQTIFTGQAALENVLREQQMYLNALGMNAQRKPSCAELIPADPEVVEWRMRETDLETNLARLRARRAQLPNLELLRVEGVQLAQHVQQLMYAENNLINELDGGVGVVPVGGVFAPS
ncbi:MAG TPA: hypothetical protein VGT08_01180 [Terracidiphilus sp.]|nr:hypothetical protein [Terracidiphilus sp.]